MKYRKEKIAGISFLLLFLSACVSTNYYTAQTLEPGKSIITPGADNLIWIAKKGKHFKKKFFFSPSLGYARGLPLRFEAGFRVYFPYIIEANIRKQLNPKSFDLFDISTALHMGVIFTDEFTAISRPYYKYGLTVSKKISMVQPYLSYYFTQNTQLYNYTDIASDYSIICFGVALPYKEDWVFPEFNYSINNHSGKGFVTFGIGLRASIGKSD